ncbi:MAG: transposase [Okeania sp. SIO3B5]|nr:transposase [Okeania sp. SIO3B5]
MLAQLCVSKCSECGFEADRDFNAAINLKNYVYQ